MSGSKRTFSFGLKPTNSKVAALFADDDDDEPAPKKMAPPRPLAEIRPPADPMVRQSADKLAEFVAKNGRSVEEMTKQRNPGNTPFKFLFDKASNDYRYYERKINEYKDAAASSTTAKPVPVTPASVPVPAPGTREHLPGSPPAPSQPPSRPPAAVGLLRERAPETHLATEAQQQGDSIAAMEAFTRLMEKKAADKKAADEEEARKAAPLLKETSFDRRRVTAVYKEDGTRGHHMQDFIPKEELAKLLSKTNDPTAKAHAEALEAQSRIGADNVGHKLLQKMGWKEGQGLGAGGTGMAAPIAASGTARDTAGLGAHDDKEVKDTDDVYEAYRKRMQLGYKYRPNPLGNPRKQYY